MNKLQKWLIFLLVACLLVTPVLAAEFTVTKTLSYENIKIMVDGAIITPKNVSGDIVEPFIVEGTTYIPIRALSEALGYDVEWDDANNTVVIKTSSDAGSDGTIGNTIETDKGTVGGFSTVGDYGGTIYSFYGIPYAEAPVGELRWKPAQEKSSWSGVLDCTEFQPTNYQFGSDLLSDFAAMPQSEDCLYLNVITPAEAASDNLPVMVWFHGGGYTMGGGIEAVYNGTRLPEQGCIVVTVNTRLGAFGLLASDLQSGSSSAGTSGNYMISDMIAALDWVKNNITAFGGDANNVTIFGESGGGGKVNALVTSPEAAGLFSKAIIQSGSSGAEALSTLEEAGNQLMEYLNVSTIEEARALPAENIVAASNELDLSYNFAIDGIYLNESTSEAYKSGNYNHVPIIIGANDGEISNLGLQLLPGLQTQIPDIASHGDSVYTYLLDQVPANWRALGGRAVHAIDLPYVFGDYDNTAKSFNGGPWAQNCLFWMTDQNIAQLIEPELTGADKKVSEDMMKMWVQFAKTGNPSIEAITWEKWSAASDGYIYISETDTVSTEMRTGFLQYLATAG